MLYTILICGRKSYYFLVVVQYLNVVQYCLVKWLNVHLLQPRVPVQGLNNIVPPSDPDPNHCLNSAKPSPQSGKGFYYICLHKCIDMPKIR